MNNINLNELRNRAYKTACEHGFHDKELSNEHCLCLIVGELMEAVEADRKGRLGKKCKSRFEMDYNRYPALVEEEKRFKCSFEKNVKDTLPDELSDAVIRLLDLAGLRNISIDDFPEEAIYGASESCVGETIGEYTKGYKHGFDDGIKNVLKYLKRNALNGKYSSMKAPNQTLCQICVAFQHSWLIENRI